MPIDLLRSYILIGRSVLYNTEFSNPMVIGHVCVAMKYMGGEVNGAPTMIEKGQAEAWAAIQSSEAAVEIASGEFRHNRHRCPASGRYTGE